MLKFKYRQDMILVIISAVTLFLHIWLLRQWQVLGMAPLAAWAVVMVCLYCTNYQCIAHNFIHHPFFQRDWLNQVFSVMNSLVVGLPQSLYRIHHMNHHRHNNDMQDEIMGDTKDHSSIYRYSKVRGRPEGILSYSLLGVLRTDMITLYRVSAGQGKGLLTLVEATAILLFWSCMAFYQTKAFFLFYLPVWYLGQSISLAQNYLEHFKAIPGNRLTDSVSCYNPVYNFLWFNNGYHQEHHARPHVHWTEVRKVRPEMLPEDQRRVVKLAHLFNF